MHHMDVSLLISKLYYWGDYKIGQKIKNMGKKFIKIITIKETDANKNQTF